MKGGWAHVKGGRGFVLEGADGADDLVILEVPDPAPPPGALSNAERAVTALVVAGLSNAEIGALRGTSARTIATQLAKVFRKLGVSSRAELVCRLTRGQ